MLRARSTAPERMDAEEDPAVFAAALDDLDRINRLSLAARPTLLWLDRLAAETGARSLSVLDVGAGSGERLRAIAAWGARRGLDLDLAGLDRSPAAAERARAHGTPGAWITADLFDLDPARRFDAVVCSLFAHHLPDPDLVRFLRWLEARARLGWMISDLHRHPLLWAAVWAGTRLLGMHPMVRHDGPVSVARGFTRADWRRLLAEAGVEAEVAWDVSFRWRVSAIRRGAG